MSRFESLVSVEDARETVAKLKIESVKFQIKDVPASVLEDGTLVLSLEGRQLPLLKMASTQLGNLTGLRRIALQDYVDNPTLVTGMIRHSLGKRTGEVVVEHNQDAIFGIKSDASVHINPLEVFDIAVDALHSVERGGVGARVDSVRFDKGVLATRFVVAHSNSPVRRVGDFSHGGVLVATNGCVAVAPYIYRLVCTNGMVRPYVFPEMAREPAQAKDYFRTSIVNMVNQAVDDLSLFVSMDEERLENPAHYVNMITRELGISDRHTRRIGNAIPAMDSTGDFASRYDVINLVSSLANSSGDSKYQEFAGSFLSSFAQHRCDNCGSKLL